MSRTDEDVAAEIRSYRQKHTEDEFYFQFMKEKKRGDKKEAQQFLRVYAVLYVRKRKRIKRIILTSKLHQLRSSLFSILLLRREDNGSHCGAKRN